MVDETSLLIPDTDLLSSMMRPLLFSLPFFRGFWATRSRGDAAAHDCLADDMGLWFYHHGKYELAGVE